MSDPGMIATDSLAVVDFSGGITDYYMGSDTRRCLRCDNLLVLRHGAVGKLFTRPGSIIYDSTNYQIPAGSQRIGTLKNFEDQLFTHSARKLYYISGGSWQTLQGPTGNDLFPAGVDTTTVVSWYAWNKHLFVTNSDFSSVQKIYKDGSNAWQLRTAGLPAIAGVTTSFTAGANNYLYRVLHSYEYVVGTVTYLDRGPVFQVAASSADAPNVNAITLNSLPVIANGATDNYDTASANLKIEIYRTTNNGQTFFFVGSVANGVTSFVDNVADTTIEDNEVLYTEGGIPENFAPPLCKFLHVMDDKGFYGHTKTGTEVFSNRVYQSIPGDIDSVPDDYYVELQDEVTGISSVTSAPIIFCKNFVYRLDGSYDQVGTGFIAPVKISDIAGCLSAQSIVQTLDGVYWAGNSGFYFSDGYQVLKVSSELDETYKTFIATAEQRRRIYGVYDVVKNRVWWSVQSDGDLDVTKCFVLDVNWGLNPSMTFTTASGGDNFAPTAIEFVSGDLVRADKRGYLFQHSAVYYSDPRINTAANPSTWDVSAIIYDYTSVALDFGTIAARKFVTRININCKNETNLSLQITSINDDGRIEANLGPIRFRGNLTWGEADVYWGDPDIIWGNYGVIDEARRFPAKGLRCQYKQVQFTNASVAILSSDSIGTCVVDSVGLTATLSDVATYDWPSQSLDYVLAFENDGYVNEFPITARTADILTFTDSKGVAPSGTQQWVIRGKPKNEILQLLAYSIDYSVFGKTSPLYRSNSTGEVGAS